MSEPLFPVFLKLAGRDVLVVGGGVVAGAKARALVHAGARVKVVAPAMSRDVLSLDVLRIERAFNPADLDGAWFVVAAATPEVNRDVVEAAEARRVFVNAVDDRESATAYLGGVVRKGGVTVAVSTDGEAPALCGLVREGLEALLPDDAAAWIETARALRPSWKAAALPHGERRPALLRAINELYAAEGERR